MNDFPPAAVKDQKEFAAASSLYNSLRPELLRQFSGSYFLMHTASRLYAIGDPKKDATGGFGDAFLNFREQHGDLLGQYFAILIGDHEA